MSYAVSAALQQAVFQTLSASVEIAAQVGEAVFDAAPPGERPATYITLGPEDARDRSDKTGHGSQHDFSVQVVTTLAGFNVAKQTAAAVSDALVDAPLVLARGKLVSLTFLRARAWRAEDARVRRIDLWFRARVDDTGPTTSEAS